MAEFEHDGWRLSYSDTGGDGPAVLLLHGLLFDRSMFDPQVAALRDRYRTTALFVTHDVGEALRLGTQVALLHGGKGSQRAGARVPGSPEHRPRSGRRSGGGSMGRARYRRDGGQRRKGPGWRLRRVDRFNYAAVHVANLRQRTIGIHVDFIPTEGWNDDLLQTVVPIFFSASTSEDVSGPWKERWRSEDVSAARETLHAVTRREDITDRLGEIEQPALVIHGEDDGAIEMERAEQLAAGLPGVVELVKVPRAGHSSTIEQPEAVTAAIERFLEKVSPA